MSKKEKFIVEFGPDGFSAKHQSLPIFTAAHSKDELILNILEAANLYFEEEKELSRNEIEVCFNFKTFFEEFNYLKSTAIARRAGINNSLITQYVKGIKNPSEKQLNKILTAIKEIGNELASIDFTSKDLESR
jgi:transcriptional regulator with XRE-family HTH domain